MSSTKVLFIPKGSTNNTVSYLNKTGHELNIIDKIIYFINNTIHFRCPLIGFEVVIYKKVQDLMGKL